MLKKFLYTLWVLILFAFMFFSIKSGGFSNFINSIENRTFDIRQSVLANSGGRKNNPNIVIIAIDDGSYEYILDKYGEWPLRRDIYAKTVDFIEQSKPTSIAFDLMFVKSIKSSADADSKLVEIFKKYDNVFTAMNLDNQPEDLRKPPVLPDKLSNRTPIPVETMEFSNCRVILDGILDATSNIGMINVARSDDGVLRSMPLFLKYRDKYYPQLGLLVAKHANKSLKVPTGSSEVILNWYGGTGTFENIPLYKLLKAVENNDTSFYDFKDKIVYFGATAASLFDIKTVPVDKVYPGVEVQATYVNNLLDGSFIHKANFGINMLIAGILAMLTIFAVLKLQSMPVAFGLSMTIYAGYVMFTYYAMRFYNIWLNIAAPLIFAMFAFIITVIIKYLIKSRDFDAQYKLATTDGLTELYNHRYFQEQLQNQVSHASRYESPLSLIIIDIDFFKKFNDNFGHQSGDAVLRQVAFELKKNVRSADIVCRYGGEEMSIILPNTKYEEAVNIANKLCTIIASKKCKLSNGKESNVTISLGVSAYGQDGKTPVELIESADKRLYNAKENGRNRVN